MSSFSLSAFSVLLGTVMVSAIFGFCTTLLMPIPRRWGAMLSVVGSLTVAYLSLFIIGYQYQVASPIDVAGAVAIARETRFPPLVQSLSASAEDGRISAWEFERRPFGPITHYAMLALKRYPDVLGEIDQIALDLAERQALDAEIDAAERTVPDAQTR